MLWLRESERSGIILSKVKYPGKDVIRKEIDEILDKSELFQNSEDKTIQLSNKIVELKPVKEGIPVKRIAQVALAVAAVVVFVTAVKNYKGVDKESDANVNHVPLATASSEVSEDSGVTQSKEFYAESLTCIYDGIDGIDKNNITSKYWQGGSSDKYFMNLRIDTVSMADGRVLTVEVPVNITDESGRIDTELQEKLWSLIGKTIDSYLTKKAYSSYDSSKNITFGYEIEDGSFNINVNGALYTSASHYLD